MGRTELNKYVYSLVGLSAIVLVVLVAIIMGMQSYLNGPPQVRGAPHAARQLEVVKRAASGSKSDIIPFPRAAVADWGTIPASPSYTAPARATVFSLKQQYNRLEFENMAQHFIAVVENKVTEGTNGISVVSEGDDVGAFYMYKPTGSFMYMARRGVPLPAEGATDEQKVDTFMQTIWTDGTLQVTGSYEKPSTPGVTYYEIHRDWDKVGLPIVNLMGTFNIPQDEKIGTMSLLNTDSETTDTDNDFNTATVGVRDGRIVSMVSNLRQVRVQGSRTYGLIPYAEAVEKLKKNAYTYLYTSPAGEGEANNEVLYPNNLVSLKDVTITESLAVYLEDLPAAPQTQLYPYYIFRGSAQSGRGHRMNFVAAVPAAAADILGTTTAKDVRLFAQNGNGFSKSQQQGTLNFVDPADAPRPALSQAPPLTGIPVARQLETMACQPPSPRDLRNLRADPGGYVYGIYHGWYIIPGRGWDVAHLSTAVHSVFAAAGVDLPMKIQTIIEDFEAAETGCPMRITGTAAEE